ncbi:MAG: hypothetical protein KC964_27305, partial [Candidatus Omnitrophica bacterium]|nr:hypothetical protein [Candidatus Omnitrophota bacterium]
AQRQLLFPSPLPHGELLPGKISLESPFYLSTRFGKWIDFGTFSLTWLTASTILYILDLDVRGYFDNIDHSLMKRAVRKHADCKWVLLYVERWMTASVIAESGIEHSREKGTPQGGVISP